ncbi:uncharacterized protein LOC106693799 [Microplitis demolitor]|uniref:uncharacterized protein LOC106693799 n=1 Tax=Microplitis demolitor TaxID=69319 RepID=UPI0006D504DE|nr:uncharacterized protein LOC106693799 [Microplitis demolitor]
MHIDDFLAASKTISILKKLFEDLNKLFPITDLGEIKCYLGINVRHNKAGEYSLNQSNYIHEILKETGMVNAKGSSIPMDLGYLKTRDNTPTVTEATYQKSSDHYCISVSTLDLTFPPLLQY